MIMWIGRLMLNIKYSPNLFLNKLAFLAFIIFLCIKYYKYRLLATIKRIVRKKSACIKRAAKNSLLLLSTIFMVCALEVVVFVASYEDTFD